ncbi:hypothetical protein AB837_00419 [bacterium AB1]|nr:hypothetical protein AB837_00419 [bacterium AB1]
MFLYENFNSHTESNHQTLKSQINDSRQRMKNNAQKIKTNQTPRDYFLLTVNWMINKDHPRKRGQDEDSMQQEWIKYIRSIDSQEVKLDSHKYETTEYFVQKMKKIRKTIKKADFSKKIKYKKRIRDIINENIKNIKSELKVRIVKQLENLLEECEYNFICGNTKLETEFINKVKLIMNENECYDAENNTLLKILSLGREISQYSQTFTQHVIGKKLGSKQEFNLQRMNIISPNSIIDIHQFVSLINSLVKLNDCFINQNFMKNITYIMINRPQEMTHFVKNYILDTFDEYSDYDIKIFENKMGMSMEEISDLIIDYLSALLYSFSYNGKQITPQDILDLFCH